MTKQGRPCLGVDVEAVLRETGSFGKFHLLLYFWIFWPILFSAVHSSQYVFNAAEADHRCLVPQCESSPPDFVTDGWGAWAFPDSGGQCEMYRPVEVGAECTPTAFLTNETQGCDAWVYEHNNTIVAEFGLACEEWKRTLVGTIHNVGIFFALPFTGYLSDTFGRRIIFIVTAVAAAVMGVIRSFSTTYIMYLAFEFLEAVVSSGVYSTGFILAVEMMSINYRVLGGNVISSTFAIGQVVTALAAWAIPYWRTLTRVIYAPSFLFIFYFFFVEESVRWLLTQGRKKEAVRIIYKAAKMNKKELSPETIKSLSDDVTENVEDRVDAADPEQIRKGQSSLVMQVLRSKVIMSRLFICSFWWITVTFIYYGLSINSVSLDGNPYVNYILSALVEIPGYFLSVVALNWFGRKRSIMTAYLICGVSLLILPFLPDTLQWLRTTLNMVGKLFISMVFSSIYIYTSELFPTNLRHRLLSICSMVGRIGSITAPQTPLLMQYMQSLPYLVFGAMAGCAGMLMLLTPETLNIRLPDTIEEAEGIAAAPRLSRRSAQ